MPHRRRTATVPDSARSRCTSAIPQIGHSPGSLAIREGCIAQVHASPVSTAGAAGADEALGSDNGTKRSATISTASVRIDSLHK